MRAVMSEILRSKPEDVLPFLGSQSVKSWLSSSASLFRENTCFVHKILGYAKQSTFEVWMDMQAALKFVAHEETGILKMQLWI